MTKSVLIGKAVDSGQPVLIDEQARRLSTYIIGGIGMGKSTLLEQIAYQDMLNGEGGGFLDPHEDSIRNLLLHVPPTRRDQVIFWDPTDLERPFGLNPFYCPAPTHLMIDSLADNFVAALKSLEEFAEIFKGGAPVMIEMLTHLAITFVVNQGYTLAEAPQFLDNQSFRMRFYGRLTQAGYPQVRRFWENFDMQSDREQRAMTASSLNKLRRFQLNTVLRTVFGQPQPTINFRQIMDEGKTLLVNLSSERIGEGNGAILGAFIVVGILQAALSRADTPEAERRPFHLIADEFQNFMTTAFPRLQAEARKYAVDTTVAHQTRAQLEEKSRATTLVVGNKIVFRVTGSDAKELAKEFELNIPEPPSQRREPKYEIVHNVLEHLRSHGHEKKDVLERYRSVADDIGKIFENADSLLRYLAGRRPPTLDLSYRREQFQRGIDQWLYSVMRSATDPKAPLNPLDWESREKSQVQRQAYQTVRLSTDALTAGLYDERERRLIFGIRLKYESYFGAVSGCALGVERIEREYLPNGVVVDNPWNLDYVLRQCLQDGRLSQARWNQMEDRLKAFREKHPKPSTDFLLRSDFPEYRSYDREVTREAQSYVKLEVFLAENLGLLAGGLRQAPCYAHTGQLEALPDKPRLYSDVEAELSNQLANLPKHQARCKVSVGVGSQQVMINTLPLEPASSAAYHASAAQIKEHSRRSYGRDRRQVEEAIESRLQILPTRPKAPGTMRTDERTHDNDDDIQFGEKGAATNA